MSTSAAHRALWVSRGSGRRPSSLASVSGRLCVVASTTLQTTWIPRIGEEATAELGRYRKTGGLGLAMPLLAAAAGLLFGTGIRDNLIAVVLVAVAVSILVAFVSSQRTLAAALSSWFEVRITAGQLPLMNPTRFDAWREKRKLRSPDERPNGPVIAQLPGTAS